MTVMSAEATFFQPWGRPSLHPRPSFQVSVEKGMLVQHSHRIDAFQVEDVA